MVIKETIATLQTDKLWFWSDPHFYHKNVIRYCKRPFSSVEEMNQAMIKNYNSVVKEDHTCVWVGDCFFCDKNKAFDIMKQLNGRKILVTGNHDKEAKHMCSLGFDMVMLDCWLTLADRDVQICHFPFKPSAVDYWHRSLWSRLTSTYYDRRYLNYRPKNKGQFLIHGHSHQKTTFNRRSIHVGVDSNNFTPVSCETIIKYINRSGL